MMRRPILTLVFFLLLAIGMAPVLHAQSVPPSERQKIEALIKYIGEMNDTKFVQGRYGGKKPRFLVGGARQD